MSKQHRQTRRDMLGGVAGAAVGMAVGCKSSSPGAPTADGSSGTEIPSSTVPQAGPVTSDPVPPDPAAPTPAPRQLGKTGYPVEAVSLGGEGVLRTRGQNAEAVPVITAALREGVRYCDTAPAYAESQDYYGEAFRAAGTGARERLTLATKTHKRDRDGSLRLLDDSLRRLGTDYVDIWQLHDLRDESDLDAIFGSGGAIHAVEQAKSDGRIKHVGITGHHDPEVLVEAMRRYDFDTVLCAINPADSRRLPFITTVVPEARRRGIGIIGMKVLAAGRLAGDPATNPSELIRYAMRYADTLIVGCSSTAEVRENLEAGRSGAALSDAEAAALEARIAPRAARYDSFKRGGA